MQISHKPIIVTFKIVHVEINNTQLRQIHINIITIHVQCVNLPPMMESIVKGSIKPVQIIKM